MDRLRFNFKSVWRISNVNKEFKMCNSYPPELLVPANISDQVKLNNFFLYETYLFEEAEKILKILALIINTISVRCSSLQ
jgi:hypothetical protein